MRYRVYRTRRRGNRREVLSYGVGTQAMGLLGEWVLWMCILGAVMFVVRIGWLALVLTLLLFCGWAGHRDAKKKKS
jgi:hypothetical protein